MNAFLDDLIAAKRSLVRTPWFTAVCIAILTLGISATVALYSAFDDLVLHPVSFPAPSRLVLAWTNDKARNYVSPSVSWPKYQLFRDQARSFSNIGGACIHAVSLTGNGDVQQLEAQRISAGLLTTLGIQPVLGRNFTAEEDAPGGPAVVIISYQLWQTRFGGRTDLLGTNILLNGEPHEVVGVLPRLSRPLAKIEALVPRFFDPLGLTKDQVQTGASYIQLYARLKDGVTLETASAELTALGEAYAKAFPGNSDAMRPNDARPLIDFVVGQHRVVFRVLLAAMAVLLLIATVNVAGLFVARLIARRKDSAVRLALGSGRGRILQLFLIESLLIAMFAATLSPLCASFILDLLQQVGRDQLPAGVTLHLHTNAALLGGALALVMGLLVGIAPAWHSSRMAVIEVLRDQSGGQTGGRGGIRLRSILIIGQMVLSVVLLVGSGLLLLSFNKLQNEDPGYRVEGVATALTIIPAERYSDPARQVQFYASVLAEMRALPGVESAGAILGMPLAGLETQPLSSYAVFGRPVPPVTERPLVGFRLIAGDYFSTLRISLKEGRFFGAGDTLSSAGVCIISESLARRLFPGRSALGQVLLSGRNADRKNEIVGVVADVKTNSLTADKIDEIYYPLSQRPSPAANFVVRTTGEPDGMEAAMKTAVGRVDPTQALSRFSTFRQLFEQALSLQKLASWLVGLFAGVAVLLSAVGLYSVLAYALEMRRNEIGVRIALGARPEQVIWLIVRQGVFLAFVGLGLGLVGAWFASHQLTTVLYAVDPRDPVIYAGVSVLLLVVALLACFFPARRASRVDPLVAIRST